MGGAEEKEGTKYNCLLKDFGGKFCFTQFEKNKDK